MKEMNRMRGKVNIIGFGDANIFSSLQLRIVDSIESDITIRANKTVDLGAEFWVKYGGKLDIETIMQVQFSENIASSLWVKPQNKMTGVYELVEAPVFTRKYPIIKDAFIRNDIPALNYGMEHDMFVGVGYSGEIYRSIIQFAPLDLSAEKLVKKAEIVLHVMYSGREFPIELHEISHANSWQEREVTWASQPDTEAVITTFPSGIYYGTAIRIDVTEIVRAWHLTNRTHQGFLLKAIDEQVQGLYKSYGTKEHAFLQPYLEVSYQDPTIFSYGRGQLQAAIDIREYEQVSAEITIKASYWDEDLEAELYVAPLNGREGEIIINKPVLESELYVPYKRDLESTIGIRSRSINLFNGELIVNVEQREGNIVIRSWEELPVAAVIRQRKYEPLPGEIAITRKVIDGLLIVKHYEDLTAGINIIGVHDDNLEGSGFVNQPDVEAELLIRYFKELDGTLKVRRYADDDSFTASLQVNKQAIDSELLVKPYEVLDSEIYIRANGEEDTNGEIFIVSPWMEAEVVIRVAAEEELQANFYVRANGYNDCEALIRIREASEADLQLETIIRVEDYKEIEAGIYPRPHLADDLSSDLMIYSEQKNEAASTLEACVEIETDYGYCFIM